MAMGQPDIKRAYIYLLIPVLLMGGAAVAGKIVAENLTPPLVGFLRNLAAGMLLLPLAWHHRRDWLQVSRRDWLLLAAQVFFSVFLAGLLLFWGYGLTGAAEASVLRSTTPFILVVASVLLLGEQMRPALAIGTLFAVVGVLVVNLATGGDTSVSNAPLLGNALVLAGVVAESTFTLLRKSISPTVTGTMMTVVLVWGGVFSFAPAALFDAARFDFAAVSWQAWVSLAYYAVPMGIVATFLWLQGVSLVPASVAGGFSGLIPVTSLLFTYVMLDEPFRWAHLIGGVAVVIGILLLSAPPGSIAGAGRGLQTLIRQFAAPRLTRAAVPVRTPAPRPVAKRSPAGRRSTPRP